MDYDVENMERRPADILVLENLRHKRLSMMKLLADIDTEIERWESVLEREDE